MVHFRRIEEKDNPALFELVRTSLKAHGLDIPGTAYFDPHLDQLFEYYTEKPLQRTYFVAADQNDHVIGGIGIDCFPEMENCCELQKLYVAEEFQGDGLGYQLIGMFEEEARRLGYRKVYLETHSNLEKALHVYAKAGYAQIPRPEFNIHPTMDRFLIKDL